MNRIIDTKIKKVLAVIIIVVIAVSIALVGYIKSNKNEDISPTTEPIIKNPIVGLWRHQEVPTLPHYSSWVITIKEDGTFKTQSNNFQSDIGISSHTESFGESGTYTLSDNIIMFRRSDTGQSRTETFEIIERDGKIQLSFKDSMGKNKSSVCVGGKIYDMIFIKE